jgi:hypothetical protein
MRTTLSLDDDVAALLEQVQRRRKAGLKEVVNTALREGLVAMTKSSERRAPVKMKTFDLGKSRLASLDNIAEVLAVAAGEDYK